MVIHTIFSKQACGSHSRRLLVGLWLLLVPGAVADDLPIFGALKTGLAARQRLNSGLGMGRLLGVRKELDNDDIDDDDVIFSTNVRATSSVGGLGGTPGLVGGASLLSTGPGTLSANLGGTYDFLGTGGSLGLGPPVFGVLSDDDLDLDLNLGFGGRRGFFKNGFGTGATSMFYNRRSGLGSGLRGFNPAPLGPKLTYVSPRTRTGFFGSAKRRSRPRFKPFGRRRRNFWWKGRHPRHFGRKCLKWRKRFPFFG